MTCACRLCKLPLLDAPLSGNVVVLAGHVVEDINTELDSERNEPDVVGLERLEHGLADVAAAFEHGDGAALQGQAGRVLELDTAHRVLGTDLPCCTAARAGP